MKRRIVCAVPLAGRAAAVAAALVLVVPVTARCAETGGWIFDTAAGCKVWNPHPQPNETIRWSGACANGMAQGRGAAQWFRGNLPFESDEGEWREGRSACRGHWVRPRRVRRHSARSASLVNVSGTFRGTWKDGCLRDSKQKAAFGVPLSAC
jgi:hypothetical protein